MSDMRDWLKLGTLALCAGLVGVMGAGLQTARAAKDIGPASAACDVHTKQSAAWQACVHTAQNDAELFYAGYWLARAGRYEEALQYLNSAQVKDERVLTYIGLATRKLGTVEKAIGFYGEALSINPNYAVARAYLGEAYLTLGQPAKAEAELDEIAARCGTTCPPYDDLRKHISNYKAGRPVWQG